MKCDFYYSSSNNKNNVHAVVWKPEGEVKAILQISHGMIEFIERYSEFAEFLNSHGILVTGNDHLGHGDSIASKDDYGYFAEHNGNDCLIEDLRHLTQEIKAMYPNVPCFLLGHSMGSFYARQYICQYGHLIDGAIIMGTGFQSYATAVLGKSLCRAIALSKGWHYKSTLINNLAFGSYNKAFEPARTEKDWLSRDAAKVDENLCDERCNFVFTLNGYYNMFHGLSRLRNRKVLRGVPSTLPILVTSGSNDPVGGFGKGVTRVYNQYKGLGIKDLTLKLYPEARHEILNETNRHEVYEDIYKWINNNL